MVGSFWQLWGFPITSLSLCKSLSTITTTTKTQLKISEIVSQPYTVQHSNFEAMTACWEPTYRLRAALFILIPRRIFLFPSFFPNVYYYSSSHSLYLHNRFQFLASIAFDCSISKSSRYIFIAVCRIVYYFSEMFWWPEWVRTIAFYRDRGTAEVTSNPQPFPFFCLIANARLHRIPTYSQLKLTHLTLSPIAIMRRYFNFLCGKYERRSVKINAELSN